MDSIERENQARNRFFLLSAMRFTAVALVMIGIANISGKLLPEFAPHLGYALLIMGVLEFFLMPVVLKKAWHGQDAQGK